VFVGEILKKISGSCEFWGPRLETTLVGRCTDEEVAEFWKSEMAERLLGLDEFPVLVDLVFRRLGEHTPLDTGIRGVARALGRW
jgi:hypothetical protein